MPGFSVPTGGSVVPVAVQATSHHRMQGLRSQLGWHSHWGWEWLPGEKGGRCGALRPRAEGLQGATGEVGLCWVFLA